MKLSVQGDGATQDKLDRGVGAAWKVFSEAGVTPFEAAIAFCVCSQWDDCAYPGADIPTEAERRAADLWKKAESEGAKVSRAIGDSAWLELRDD